MSAALIVDLLAAVAADPEAQMGLVVGRSGLARDRETLGLAEGTSLVVESRTGFDIHKVGSLVDSVGRSADLDIGMENSEVGCIFQVLVFDSVVKGSADDSGIGWFDVEVLQEVAVRLAGFEPAMLRKVPLQGELAKYRELVSALSAT